MRILKANLRDWFWLCLIAIPVSLVSAFVASVFVRESSFGEITKDVYRVIFLSITGLKIMILTLSYLYVAWLGNQYHLTFAEAEILIVKSELTKPLVVWSEEGLRRRATALLDEERIKRMLNRIFRS